MAEPITFVIPGSEITEATRGAPGAAGDSRVKHFVKPRAERAAGEVVRVQAIPGQDLVEIEIVNGPTLTLHPETARDLMLSQSELPRRSRGGAEPSEVAVPVRLAWRGLEQVRAARSGTSTRGLLGGVDLGFFKVLIGKAAEPAKDIVAAKVVEKFDGSVDAGVYRLVPEGLEPLSSRKGPRPLNAIEPSVASAGPILVLVHGTFSSTAGTFSKLWTDHPQRVADLFAAYGSRVYALEHPTLGASPIENALALAKILPAGAEVHFLTHSRGGLVAEAFCRAAKGIGEADLAIFKGNEYAQQRKHLTELGGLLAEKGIRPERLVRVACPARGTLLASKRLDAYISIFKWSLELARIPVAPQLVEFLGEVAQRRSDPMKIPGLAAQIPDSPLVRWLHSAQEPIGTDLRVVAGDMQGDSVSAWVKTLLADAFFWTDNDLVVQTRSMYGGSPRAPSRASFVLDRGGKVTHFSYFSNEATAKAIVEALTKPDLPVEFRAIGPLSWAGEDASGVRAARAKRDVAQDAGDKPAVFVLPGILGSNLKAGDDRVWLAWRIIGGLDRLAYAEGGEDNVAPDGAISSMYEDLEEFLSRTHQVVEFAYDWRVPIEEEAGRLAAQIDQALDRRASTGLPVRIVAHSMGGLVARTVQLVRPDVWDRMMRVSGARMLMLGTPNGGSYAPMQVLSGDDSFGNMLALVGLPFQDHKARQLMASLPGFIQLQAAVDSRLSTEAAWRDLATKDVAAVEERNWWHHDERQLEVYRWGIPSDAVLGRAIALRRRLDRQRDDDLPGFKDKLALVVGSADFTPADYRMEAEGLVYLDAHGGGDGRVTLESAMLPGVTTWRVDCVHGDLAKFSKGFDAYLDLLERGGTTALVAVPGVARGGEAQAPRYQLIPSRPSRGLTSVQPPADRADVLAAARTEESLPEARVPVLQLSVMHGDLRFIGDPLMLGHYRSQTLTGAEAVMDGIVGRVLTASLEAGVYPFEPGSHKVFLNTNVDSDNPWKLPAPKAVVIVGLGEESELRPEHLVETVRNGAIAWAQRVAEQDRQASTTFELAATLIGSGGTGVSPAQSAQLLAEGVRQANIRLAGIKHPMVSHLKLVELYRDRALEAWRGLRVKVSADAAGFRLAETVESHDGGLPRPLDGDYRGANYDFVSAIASEKSATGEFRINYTLDTRRARTELRAQSTQARLVQVLVEKGSTNDNIDRSIGRTLFDLLVPVELEPLLASSRELQMELDDDTAGIPWELLDSGKDEGGTQKPWAINCHLLRKLRTASFRQRPLDANAEDGILIIGEPRCDKALYSRLPGARAEAREVSASLSGSMFQVTSLIAPDESAKEGFEAEAIIKALFSRRWRVVHISGHGEAVLPDGTAGGVVLSDGVFLRAEEIRSMRVVPELVFVNCCHLGIRASHLPQFAASVAKELIKVGVQCVIAAGWAVDDDAAREFASAFYKALLNGARFIEAVGAAREAAHRRKGNTWAAYQCYGDPDWRFRPPLNKGVPSIDLGQEYAGVASSQSLILALETIAIKARHHKKDSDTQQRRILYLERHFAHRWQREGKVAEAFADAWSETGASAKAIQWYERAQNAPDGLATMRATEQLCNLKARSAWEGFRNKRSTQSAARARDLINEAIGRLEDLSRLGESMERQSLIGSAYKRLAMIERALQKDNTELARKSARHYQRAEDLGRATAQPNVFYPMLNAAAAALVTRDPVDKEAWARIRQALSGPDQDFWSHVGRIEVAVYEAIQAGKLARELASISEEYRRVHERVSSPRMWTSVLDQLEFVLPAYEARAKAGEKRAVAALMNNVRGYVAK